MPKKKKKTDTIQFKYKYVIPENLRDLYVNGLFGGITPRNEVHIHFYNERHPIPNWISCKVDNQGIIGKVVDHDIGGDAVRMVQASIVMDFSTAIAMRDWLNDRIAYLEKNLQKNKEK